MFPLYDFQREKGKVPYLTILLIFFNAFFFFLFFKNLNFFIQKFGFIPNDFLERKNFSNIFSAMFIHGNFFHLLVNMWFLWVFGDNVEQKLGKIKFLFLYFLSGLGAFFFHLVMALEKSTPVIGASGAISGILGAYLILFPRNKILTLIPIFYFYRLIVIPANFFIIIWFLYQFFAMSFNSHIAWWAHIGGFLSGIFFVKATRKRK